MLRSYQAELNGSELIWIDAPPPAGAHRRVVVVVDDADVQRAAGYSFGDLAGRLQWRGNAVDQQRLQRDAW